MAHPPRRTSQRDMRLSSEHRPRVVACAACLLIAIGACADARTTADTSAAADAHASVVAAAATDSSRARGISLTGEYALLSEDGVSVGDTTVLCAAPARGELRLTDSTWYRGDSLHAGCEDRRGRRSYADSGRVRPAADYWSLEAPDGPGGTWQERDRLWRRGMDTVQTGWEDAPRLWVRRMPP